MSLHDLIVTKWHARFQGRTMRVSIGRGGIGVKHGEGDNITPRGVFEIENWFYRRDRMVAKYEPIHLHDGWSDDPSDPDYNQLILQPHEFSHERLMRPDHLYDLIGVMNFNRNPIKAGAGSAIFLHTWRRSRFPTEGCVALSPQDLKFVARNWTAHSRVVIQ